MDFSFLGFHLSIGLTFLLLVAAIALLITATIYLKTNVSGIVTNMMANNNERARWFFIGALIALGLYILLNSSFLISLFMIPDVSLVTSGAVIDTARFGWGTYLLLSINVILMIAAVVLIFMGYSYVDPATNNGAAGELVRALALSSGIITAILTLPLVYMFYGVVSYNNFLDTRVTSVINPLANGSRDEILFIDSSTSLNKPITTPLTRPEMRCRPKVNQDFIYSPNEEDEINRQRERLRYGRLNNYREEI